MKEHQFFDEIGILPTSVNIIRLPTLWHWHEQEVELDTLLQSRWERHGQSIWKGLSHARWLQRWGSIYALWLPVSTSTWPSLPTVWHSRWWFLTITAERFMWHIIITTMQQLPLWLQNSGRTVYDKGSLASDTRPGTPEVSYPEAPDIYMWF